MTNTPAPILIASIKSSEIEKQFNLSVDNSARFFSSGADVLTYWKNTKSTLPAYVFLDYGILSDNAPGLRVSKQIRDLEKQWDVTDTCKIYLMAEQPNALSEISAHRYGATGIIKKSCSDIQDILKQETSVINDFSISDIVEPANELSPALLRRMETIKGILRKFIGSAATKVAEQAHALLLSGQLEASEQAYIEYLVSRIPTDEMQVGFLSTVRK